MKVRFPRFKWRLQFSLLTLFGVMTAVAVGFGFASIIRLQLAVWALSNSDIEVQSGFVSLRLTINTPAAKQLKDFGPQANWALQRALADPERFAAAHVMLSMTNNDGFIVPTATEMKCERPFPAEQISTSNRFPSSKNSGEIAWARIDLLT